MASIQNQRGRNNPVSRRGRGRGGRGASYGRSYADIARETLNIFAEAGPSYSEKVAKDSVFYESGSLKPIELEIGDNAGTTIITVERGDSLAVARKYSHENPCVLNMASMHKPGGGWLGGATAQEEMICYRSGLYNSLKRYAERYPLADYDAIYSRNVPVIRDDEMKVFRRGGHYELSFISIAALCNPDLIHGCLRPDDAKRTAEKIRTMLRAAHAQGHRTMILGAFGCGAYGNPPRQTAGIFRDVLDEDEFTGRNSEKENERKRPAFDRIVFAIVDGARTENYEVFKNMLA